MKALETVNETKLLSKITKAIDHRRKKKAIRSIRMELSFWGINTDDISDADIENVCTRIALLASQFGTTCEQAGQALRQALWK